MSREFTHEAVMKFLPAQFSWIWCKCLLRNLIHSKIFNLTKYREVLVKYSLLITHAEMPLWIWHQLGERLTASFQIINSLIESWGVRLTFLECNGNEKRNCEGGFWALKFACFWKAKWPVPKEYILQWITQQNHQRDNTHCLNHKSYLHFTHDVTFTLTSKHARESI